MDLNKYMERGIAELVKTAGRFYLSNPKGIAFLAGMASEVKKSADRRSEQEQRGVHVPPLIIASIASQCNLYCAGCYSRAAGACAENAAEDLSVGEWERIFNEASELGVTFVLLAGGEPLTRRDVIERAAAFKNMIFPVFTNGTMMDESYVRLFEQNRNLIPVFSMEGDRSITDARRGEGVHEAVQNVMRQFKKKKALFGASITVTRENMDAVADSGFVRGLQSDGCGLLFFVEYVPMEEGTEHLMLDDEDIKRMQDAVDKLKKEFGNMMIVSFPGDEEMMGGCLASGRGFFHINSTGGAEPCPFSPYSKQNLRTQTIEQVLRSDFFKDLRGVAAKAEHHGGCTLFDNRLDVEVLLEKSTEL